ncbi:caspase family protein [Rhodoplanes sp. SY1]|uniref:caspase family protein n=1 Tax=Rhodoplanes sp. SY1 TaxID=3166646 RepID=UPI0038B51563
MICSSQAVAETRAVVVGIDNYSNVRPLKGAVADARDIATALQRRGVRDLAVFRDKEASRERVLAAIDKMIDRAGRGDLVIIAFAGHGSREQWGARRPPGTQEGELHEVFLLADVVLPDSNGRIDLKRGGSARERIAGTEMNVRLRKLDAKGARTVFVADTCHAGGLTRAPLPESEIEELSYRVVQPYRYRDGEDPLAGLLAALPAPVEIEALPSVTFLAAVDDSTKAPEVPIPPGSNTRRGALSFAFARIIDGDAPTARPGVVSRGEVVDYVKATVRTYSGNKQDPDLRPRANFDQILIDVSRDLTAAAAVPDPAPISRTVQVHVLGGAPIAASTGRNGMFELRPAASKQEADLVLDVKARTAYSSGGDLVASDLGGNELAGIAEREVALRRLLALSRPRPREIRLAGGDRRYLSKEVVVVDPRRQASGSDQPEHYLLFNITGTGQVQFLYPYPDKGDPPTLPKDWTFGGIDARPPFGADTLVLVVSDKPLDSLIVKIRALDKRVAALDVVDLLEKEVQTSDMKIGLQGLFTAPRPAP